MPELAESQMYRRFRDMDVRALKRKLAWHLKYAGIIQKVLEERKKEQS